MRMLVAHGYLADPSRHWFPWLVEHYGVDTVSMIGLPNPERPDLETWVHAASAAIGEVDEETILLGHSLGCVTLLHALNRLSGPWRLGGLVLVAGFVDPLPNLPALDPFTAEPLDLERIRRHTAVRHVLRSDDDDVVSSDLTERMAGLLEAPVSVVPGAGHFVDRQGVRELPALEPILDPLLGR
ncbi:RBBP9/YdeN family alpha/beta hydrolase [Labedella endophytica]|uniref:Serine hydrolase family protein n=1 Tax=Labedella endophytica TaxID=1523160 RepID=A0A3S0X4J3_9MICO|nr:alpha/beta hydrolase [Labedella endophytica]RUQ98026.1 serine hydrolase family protein [Labedella endophytica]